MPSPPPGIYIAVVGPGGVGSIFLSQLAHLKTTHPLGPSLNLVAILRSKTCIQAASSSNPLSLSTWSNDLSSSSTPSPTPQALASWLSETFPPRRAILVDNTSSQAIADAYPLFLARGISIVTPNKKPFSASQHLFDSIFQAAFNPTSNPSAGFIYHESSVGAGMPIISTLRDLLVTGDRVKRIEGVMSGSLSFLFNNFMPLSPASPSSTDNNNSSKQKKWSDHVAVAKQLGYTEPDPRDDLSGLDVARKLVILARVAGIQVAGPEAFSVESLIPEALADAASGDEFMAKLPDFDAQMETLRNEVAAQGKVLRYIGSADLESGTLSVKMVRVAGDSPFAGLSGSANVFSFWTERYGDDPLVVKGAGAGGEVTAMGVLADLCKVVERLG